MVSFLISHALGGYQEENRSYLLHANFTGKESPEFPLTPCGPGTQQALLKPAARSSQLHRGGMDASSSLLSSSMDTGLCHTPVLGCTLLDPK